MRSIATVLFLIELSFGVTRAVAGNPIAAAKNCFLKRLESVIPDSDGSHKFNELLSSDREAQADFERLTPDVQEKVRGFKPVRESWLKAEKVSKKLRKLGADYEQHLSELEWNDQFDEHGSKFYVILKSPSRNAVSGIKAGAKVLKSKEFQKYLDFAEADHGLIVIDPETPLQVSGYFGEHDIGVPGRKWVVVIKPNTSWSTMVHEWEHKIDYIDHDRKGLSLVSGKLEQPLLGAQGWAENIETKFSSELNATTRQYKLYWDSKSFPALDVINTVLYRADNQVKVAVARIVLSPLDPRHYLLLGRGGLNYILPFVAPTAITAATLCGLKHYLNKLGPDGTYEGTLDFVTDFEPGCK